MTVELHSPPRIFVGGMAGSRDYYGAPTLINDQWRAYHPAAAADSWERVLAFLAEHVRRGPP
jgi:carboxymethylenebutenolidase